MTYLKATLHGAAAGALPGALIGWLFGLFSWIDPLTSSLLLALYGLVLGAVLGGLLNVVVYAGRVGGGTLQPSQLSNPPATTSSSTSIRQISLHANWTPEAKCKPSSMALEGEATRIVDFGGFH